MKTHQTLKFMKHLDFTDGWVTDLVEMQVEEGQEASHQSALDR
jgi:hypothetical protein